jgi:hypothetical protein
MIFHKMSFADYRAIKAINASAIKQGVKSMAAMQAELTDAQDDEGINLSHLDLGTAIHAMMLQPELDGVTCYDGPVRRGKAYDAFVEANPGKLIMTQSDYNAARVHSSGAMKSRTIRGLLHRAECEMVLTWGSDDAKYGGVDVRYKARLDAYDSTNGILIDIKTSRDIDAMRFGKAFFGLGYDIQLAWYRRGLRAHGLPCNAVKVIAVENGDQVDSVVFDVPSAQIDKAEVKIEEILNRYALAVAQGKYPGKHNGAEEVPLCIPSWEEIEMEIGMEGIEQI